MNKLMVCIFVMLLFSNCKSRNSSLQSFDSDNDLGTENSKSISDRLDAQASVLSTLKSQVVELDKSFAQQLQTTLPPTAFAQLGAENQSVMSSEQTSFGLVENTPLPDDDSSITALEEVINSYKKGGLQ